jgi:hypothetical protein
LFRYWIFHDRSNRRKLYSRRRAGVTENLNAD